MELVILVSVLIVFLLFFVGVSTLRRVVPTNEVHIVQSTKTTLSYGKDTGQGNTYYEWPSFIPVIGINKMVLPVSVFDLDLSGYEAYDKGRLPFIVDVKAFFRIADSNLAAQRVYSFEELNEQLKAIVQGAIRVVLANNDIEEILQGRSTFGDQFTAEVKEQLSNWGVDTVKNIELMDIRDGKESHVIRNIMEKKKSHIEMESRLEVARNRKDGEIGEIESRKEVDLQSQNAALEVGIRTIETERSIALREAEKIQEIKQQEKLTKEREMQVKLVEETQRAEIDRQVLSVNTQAKKDAIVTEAMGALESKKLEVEGIALEGQAKAEAAKAMELVPVQAQKELAKEIGANELYQKYLITIRQIEAVQAVGEKQAIALAEAEVKIIANTGDAGSGLTSIMDLFSSRGGTAVGAMLEGFANTEKGAEILRKD